jgi:hypothetical protein
MRRGLACLVYALAIVAIAIGCDRLAAEVLYGRSTGFAPAAGSYYHASVAPKLEQVEERGDEGRDPLFIGNSLTMLGVDPASFDQELERHGISSSSYNLALPSIGVAFWAEFFDRYWRDPIPRDLLLGVQPRDVNPRGSVFTNDIIDRFFAEEDDQNAVQRFAEEALSDAFILWQRRGTLFIDTGRIPIGEGAGSTDISVTGSQGFSVTGPPFTFTPEQLRRNRRKATPVEGPPFVFDPPAEKALDQLAEQQAAVGGRLILFNFPIFYDSEPEGAPGVETDFVRTMREYARTQENVVFVDAAARTRSRFTAHDYVDENHFDPAAARRFSAYLADMLAPLLDRD